MNVNRDRILLDRSTKQLGQRLSSVGQHDAVLDVAVRDEFTESFIRGIGFEQSVELDNPLCPGAVRFVIHDDMGLKISWNAVLIDRALFPGSCGCRKGVFLLGYYATHEYRDRQKRYDH